MIKFEELNRSHNREEFDCGVEALNDFLKNTARQNLKKGLSRTFVIVEDSNPTKILGFYTLALFEVTARKLPSQYSKKYRGNVPAIKLARLAVAKEKQCQGFGQHMIINALKRIVTVVENIGIVGFFVDAKDEKAKAYYEKFEFIPLPDHPLELFLPLATLQKLIKKFFHE